jgi:plastocyanin
MKRALSLLWVIALSACAGGGGLPIAPNSTNRTAQNASTAGFASVNWIVGTGASTYSYSLQDLDFYPNAITIDAGDTISYQVASGSGGDAHTVTFVPPGQKIPPPGDPNNVKPAGGTVVDGTKFVNSGILFGGQTFTLKFVKAGTYKILCLFHEPAMVMTVAVHNTGTPYPHDQAYYTHQGSIDLWEDLGEAQRSVAAYPFANGGTTIAAGIDPGLLAFPPPDSTVLRYINSNDTSSTTLASEGNKTIKVGTVLTWMNETTNEPHTVTIVPAGQTDLPNIPPDPPVNALPYPKITVFDGSHVVNSGTLARAPGAPYAFAVKFTAAGKYFYGCLYHDNSRMTGWITVVP